MIEVREGGLLLYGSLWPWEEIQAVSAYSLELPGGLPPVTFLVLDHVCGEFAEIDHESAAFVALLEGLGRHLALPSGWDDAVRALGPGASLAVYARG